MAKRRELCFGEFDSITRVFINAEEYYVPVDLSKKTPREIVSLKLAAIVDLSSDNIFCSLWNWNKVKPLFIQGGYLVRGDSYSGPRNLQKWIKTTKSIDSRITKALVDIASDPNLHFTVLQLLLDSGVVRQDDPTEY